MELFIHIFTIATITAMMSAVVAMMVGIPVMITLDNMKQSREDKARKARIASFDFSD